MRAAFTVRTTLLGLGSWLIPFNLVLDLAVFVALMKRPLALYLHDIDLRYLLIPIISTSMGIVAALAAASVRRDRSGQA